jgi:hypothetical protein
MLPDKTLVVTRQDIERGDLDPVLLALSPEQFSRAELAGLCGAVRLRFEHAACADDLFLNPQARHFVQSLHRAWPWAGYFLRCAVLTPNSPPPQMIDAGVLVGWALCHTSEILVVRRDKPGSVAMTFCDDEFRAAVEDLLDRAEQLGQAAGLCRSAIGRRRKALAFAIGSFFSLGENPIPPKSR